MRFGIYQAYWDKEWGKDALPYIARVKTIGFDILEVSVADLANSTDEYCKELRKEAENNGIVLTGGYGPTADHNISSQDKRTCDSTFEFYKKLFYKMRLAGIKKLGGALYSYWPIDPKKDNNRAVDFANSVSGMQKLSEIAGDYTIDLNMEALNRFEGYLINTGDECIKYVKKVNRKNVHVMLDTFHMNIEEESMTEPILAAGPLLGHFHVGEPNRKPPHNGRMPWKEIGESLRRINYEGDVVMEPFVLPGGGVGKDIRIWRSFYNDTSDAMLDAKVKESLIFLKKEFCGDSHDSFYD